MTTCALGLVYRSGATPKVDRVWARALVIRHAREARFRLLDVLELDDDRAANARVVHTLERLAASTDARVLVTDGVHRSIARRLARELGLRHEPVPARARPSTLD